MRRKQTNNNISSLQYPLSILIPTLLLVVGYSSIFCGSHDTFCFVAGFVVPTTTTITTTKKQKQQQLVLSPLRSAPTSEGTSIQDLNDDKENNNNNSKDKIIDVVTDDDDYDADFAYASQIFDLDAQEPDLKKLGEQMFSEDAFLYKLEDIIKGENNEINKDEEEEDEDDKKYYSARRQGLPQTVIENRDEHVAKLDRSLRQYDKDMGILQYMFGKEEASIKHEYDDVHFSTRYALISHGSTNGMDGPITNYANFGALGAFQVSRDRILNIPACRMARPGRDQEEWSQVLIRLRNKGKQDGIIMNYKGFRVDLMDIRPFYVTEAVVWNCFDDNGDYYGQAMLFDREKTRQVGV